MPKMSSLQVKANARKKAFVTLFSAMVTAYGKDSVVKIGDTELAVIVDYAGEGVPIWATIKPVIKEYEDKSTAKKDYEAYDGFSEADAYEIEAKAKAEKNAEKERLKQAKIERDKKAREKRANEKKTE